MSRSHVVRGSCCLLAPFEMLWVLTVGLAKGAFWLLTISVLLFVAAVPYLVQAAVYLYAVTFMICGLAIFGVVLAGAAMVCASLSPAFRRWLASTQGYKRHLAKLPGLDKTDSASLGTTLLIYLLLASAGSWVLVLPFFIKAELTAALVVCALAGLVLLHGWAIRGWSFKISRGTSAASSARSSRFEHISQLHELRAMDPAEFERYVGHMFEEMGYQVKFTSYSSDEGVDLILRGANSRVVVQCKRYSGTVGQPVVRDLYGTMMHERADSAYLITTGVFSSPAKEWAKGKPIQLVDGVALVQWIEQLRKKKSDSTRRSDQVPPPKPYPFPLKQVTNEVSRKGYVWVALIAVLASPFLCITAGANVSRAVEQSTTVAPTPYVELTPSDTMMPTLDLTSALEPTVRPTPTPHPSPMPSPSCTPSPIPADTPEPANCWNAQYVADVTIPDGTRLDPGEMFTKTWRVRNVGTCIWEKVTLVLSSGENMGASVIDVSRTEPGETIEINARMTAPTESGRYRSEWSFSNGSSSFDLLTVVIEVRALPTPAPEPTQRLSN